jgi:thiamine pyrophosphokinase
LKKIGVTPCIIIGDLDSITGEIPSETETIKVSAEKNETDTELAVRFAAEKGYGKIFFFGMLGGRLSHTLANLQNIVSFAEKGIAAIIIGENCAIEVIHNAGISYPERMTGFVSVLSHSEISEGVTVKGLKYELDNAVLTNKVPLGVSNEFIGRESFIEVKNGTLIVVSEEFV